MLLAAALLGAWLAVHAESAGGTFAGKDGRIAFNRLLENDKGGATSRIVTVKKNGKQPKALTRRCCSFAEDPSWSPNGRRLAYSGERHIFTMTRNGRDRERLTRGKTFEGRRFSEDITPSWSPAGTQVVFARWYRNFTTDLLVVDSDGSGLRAIETSKLNPSDPSWAPNGEWIAFLADSLGSQPNGIYRIRPDGSDLELVLKLRGRLKSGLDWSPDGELLAFSTRPGGTRTEIHTVRSDGSQQTRLTDGRRAAFDPAFAPSGKRIAFTAGGTLKVIDADGDNERRLLAKGRGIGDFNPSWQPR
jgi:Tol biopolymer transport system component